MKKTLGHPKADEAARQAFEQTLQAHRAIVFVDESGFAHDMPRTHGYALRAQRCLGRQDGQAKGRTHVLGACLNQKLLTPCWVNSSVDIFYAWLTQDLLPQLPRNALIVMDNAAFHKRQAIQQALRVAIHLNIYLPPYCPDLNPFEHEGAQAKSIRPAHACSIDALFSLFSL